MASVSADASAADGSRLQQQLESVHISEPPRIELTFAPPLPGATDGGAVGVLDSSFNPPTRAH
eukprot:620266-Prymnesium_polylepis.1